MDKATTDLIETLGYMASITAMVVAFLKYRSKE